LKEAAIMGPSPAFMLHSEIEKTVYDWIQDDPVRAEPGSAGAFRVHPDIEHVFR
jgi:hypothetical protein